MYICNIVQEPIPFASKYHHLNIVLTLKINDSRSKRLSIKGRTFDYHIWYGQVAPCGYKLGVTSHSPFRPFL